jgi:hypothetical protein
VRSSLAGLCRIHRRRKVKSIFPEFVLMVPLKKITDPSEGDAL